MADRSVSVLLKANVSGYLASIEKAKLTTRDFARDSAQSAKVHGAAWDRIGKGMLITGGAIAVGIGMAVKTFAEFDAQMSQVKALSHATAADMDKLRTSAMKTGTAFGYSAKQSADAEIELVKAGLSVKDILGGALQGALTLAADGQMNVADATTIAASAMTIFNKTGADVPHIADLLAAGADKALGSVGDLGQALTSGGTVANQFGWSLESTVGTLAEFAQNAQIGERGGTLLRQMLLQLVNPSKQAQDIMDKYGFSITDANGQMVNSSELAGRLQKSFGSLTPAVQNHALAVIFGAHAIQGANILMKDGAKVNADWAVKVDDAGFAAEQARKKMDNLKGDVSKLSAAFTNDLIQSGSAANGMLRGLTQTATGLLNGFGDLPKPVQEVGLGLGAASSAALLFGGSVAVILPKISAAQKSLGEMGRSGGLLSRGLGGTAGVLTGPWGIALTGAAIGLGILAKKHEEAKQKVVDLTQSLNQETGALTAASRAQLFKNLQDDGTIKFANELGVSLSTVADAAGGSAPALASLNMQLAPFLAGQDANAAKARALADSVGIQNGVVAQSQQEWKKQYAAAVDAQKAGVELTASQKALLGAADATNGAIGGQNSKLATLVDRLDAATSKTLGMRSANRDWFGSIDDAQKALKENGRTLDIHTEKGRANASALDAMAAAAQNRADKAKASGKTDGYVINQLETERSKLYDTARQFGLSKTAAQRYVDTVLKIPRSRPTTVSLVGYDKAIAQAQNLGQTLRANSLIAARGYAGGNNYNGPPGATGGLFTGTSFLHRSRGGPVWGGPPGRDTVPAMLDNGEFVINAKSTKAIGPPVLDALNHMADGGLARKIRASGARAYAAGGLVGDANLSDIQSLLSGTITTKDDVSGARARQARATAALVAAEAALRRLRKDHASASQIHAEEQRILADRLALASATSKLKAVTASYAAGQRPLALRYAAAVASTVRTDATFIANLNKLTARGFGALAQELLAQGDADARTIAAQEVKMGDSALRAVQNNLIKDSNYQRALSSMFSGVASGGGNPVVQGQGPMVIYVQNPFTGDYLIAKSGAVANQQLTAAARSVAQRPR